MSLLIAAICIAGGLLSLLLVARRHTSVRRRTAAALLQMAIWLAAWLLFQPPQLLPAPGTAVLNSERLQAGNELAPTAAGPRQAITPALTGTELAALPTLAVSGAGLYREDLLALPPVRLESENSDPELAEADGWQVNWSRRLSLGQELSLQLRVPPTLPADTPVKLLDPFDTVVAQTTIGESRTVTLADTPRLSGRWEYRLQLGEGETARREPLPVQVDRGERPRVLLWLARPGFESAALSRWLQESAVPARVVTRLAPGIERTRNLNGFDSGDRAPLDPANGFDLLILDSQLWPQLDRRQRQQLQQQASLLWLVGDTVPDGFIDYARAHGMALHRDAAAQLRAPFGDSDTPALGTSGFRPAALQTGDRILRGERIGPAAGDDIALHWSRATADGALGFVFFRNSYRWVTAGYHQAFARLWQAVLKPQLAHLGEGAAVAVRQAMPRAGHRITLCSRGFTSAAPVLSAVGGERRLKGTPSPGSCYAYWPRESGWYQLEGTGEMTAAPFSLYVFAADAWPGWQHTLKTAATRQMATARLGPGIDPAPPKRPLPRYWLALLLAGLLAISWWGERKLKR
ncbi:hypothetical protein AWR36_010820 [Microbulbifer flavimaris]|uniref:Uncharacterized protein n=1 Tax=Microbulbifer flavimaris TaxID=1781068 RepID=A0ABX4I090_9GAMM|nr:MULTISPECIES: hypothetical protein [Microbulbifer]KUJ83024.1 hypothetical protein AVO43_10800 [Microbulbifer sp. ZGT114]PCO05208.1 hypothetical protein AWR36_010820 [Microbulbifer flavimaris]